MLLGAVLGLRQPSASFAGSVHSACQTASTRSWSSTVLAAIDQADAARILVTPTVRRTHPLPAVQVIGGISASTKFADAIGLPPEQQNGA
jgi:hypothetical protein